MNRKATSQKERTPQKERVRKPKVQVESAIDVITKATPAVPVEPMEAEIAEALEQPEVLEQSSPLIIEEADVDEVIKSLNSPLIEEDDNLDDLLGSAADERDDEPDELYDHAAMIIIGDEQRPAPHLVESSSTLLAHRGTRKITREELAQVSTPEGTRTHQPIAHIGIVEALVETLAFRHIHVVREEYAVSPDGARMFGVLDLDYQYATLDTFRFSIGLRNANDKTMRLGMTIGCRVFICDNMAFRGDFTPVLAKHTRKLDLEETLAIGVDRMQRGFEPLREQITSWQQWELTDNDAKLIIYEAFLDGALPLPRHLLPIVHRHYFRPEYEAFVPRTLWSLLNAFTSAFKELKPVRQFQATAKLGGFIAAKGEVIHHAQAMLSAHNEEVMQAMHA